MQAVSIPASVRLSTFYSNPLNIIRRMDAAGVSGFVLFNRLFEPDIDLEKEELCSPFNLSHDTDYRLPLRYAGLLEGTVRASICCSSGFLEGEQVARALLAGADVVQVVTALFKSGVSHIQTMRRDLDAWMGEKDYASASDCRGKLSKRHLNDPFAYTRGQYAALLMNPREGLEQYPVP
ncbi:MAG: hypothetical protein JXR37_11070 [Kiritimatiellae bacterium]|nr:hypothetical protein [Kiritimatiellia bacterium]